MSTTDSAHKPVVFCPDPSAHEHKDHKLQDAAAGAALYHHDDAGGKQKINPLDENGRLSSAGAAASLKYAKAQDLPSFPIVGIEKEQSAGSAATQAHANHKSFEYWKPGKIDDSQKAAMLAKDYKMDPLWQPKASAAGSKAAMLAAAGPGKDWWQPSATKDGGSAAEIAMRTKGLSPQAYGGVGDQQKKNAMLAATQSVKGRSRAGSTPAAPAPALYPDAHNAEQNAYNAAMEASRITHLSKNVTPQMFTEHPPIAFDAEDRKHNESLKASAIAMAKQMYAVQRVDDDGNISLDANEVAARTAHNRQSTSGETDLKTQAMQYLTLQDAAQKLASERLAKIQNPDETAAFRSYYGYPSSQPRSRMSVRNSRNLGRPSSAGADAQDPDSSDEENANRVRRRQSALNKQVADVDQKRDADRKNLLAAAERRVHAQMTEMDQNVYDRTGRMSQAMVEQWDAKARAKAAANSEARMQNHGKVDIGGGKWMDQSAIDAIAAARIKPTLDEISEKAARQREHDETVRLEEEQRKRQLATEKERAAESKAEQKRTREIEKNEARIKKEQEKQARQNEKELDRQRALEDKRRSREAKTLVATSATTSAAAHRPTTADTTEIRASTSSTEPVTALTTETTTTSAISDEPPQIPAPDFRLGSVDVGAHEAIDENDLKQPAVLPSISKTEKRQDKEVVPVKATTPAIAAPATTTLTKEPTSPTARRSSTGFRGLFSKMKRSSKDPTAASTTAIAPSVTSSKAVTTTSSTSKPSTSSEIAPGIIPDTTNVPSGGLLLPNLVAKAETATSDVSDLSDSDDNLYAAPEQERGRTRSRGTMSSTEYEEARDTLAPPPQPEYVSSKHHESPSTGSKFHEEV